jgi:hypothetical protein
MLTWRVVSAAVLWEAAVAAATAGWTSRNDKVTSLRPLTLADAYSHAPVQQEASPGDPPNVRPTLADAYGGVSDSVFSNLKLRSRANEPNTLAGIKDQDQGSRIRWSGVKDTCSRVRQDISYVPKCVLQSLVVTLLSLFVTLVLLIETPLGLLLIPLLLLAIGYLDDQRRRGDNERRDETRRWERRQRLFNRESALN